MRPPLVSDAVSPLLRGAKEYPLGLTGHVLLFVSTSSGQGYIPGRGLLVEGKVYGEIISHRVAYGFSRFGAFVAPDSDVGYPTFCLAVYGDALNERESVPGTRATCLV